MTILPFPTAPRPTSSTACAGSGTIVVLPYNVTRGAYSRKPRRSKNGTPEERAAKSSAEHQPSLDRRNLGHNPLRSKVIAVSAAVTIVGKVVHGRHGFDLARLRINSATAKEWLADLREGAEHARSIANEADWAIALMEERGFTI